VFVPAWEGPDEPFHLSYAAGFADTSLLAALGSRPVDGAILSSAAIRPCAAALRSLLGCPAFGTKPAAFNLLEPISPPPFASALENPESNQPPLFYAAAGLLIRTMGAGGAEERLLAMRSFSAALVLIALLGPLRRIAADAGREATAAGLLLLLLPGLAESLARASNDAAVFCWAAFFVDAVRRSSRTPVLAALSATGPLLKLTAIPVAVFGVLELWRLGKRGAACVCAAATLVVFPLQALRHWRFGGVYELNRPTGGIQESGAQIAGGAVRSLYTFVKTIPWLGEWSFFRAPIAVVALWFGLVLLFLLFLLVSRKESAMGPHFGASLFAGAGLSAFAIANRRFFGVWGGVGGWYAWSWAPWLFVAGSTVSGLGKGSRRALTILLAALVLIANVAFYRRALSLYGVAR
jgi:hypothetical protein